MCTPHMWIVIPSALWRLLLCRSDLIPVGGQPGIPMELFEEPKMGAGLTTGQAGAFGTGRKIARQSLQMLPRYKLKTHSLAAWEHQLCP